MQSVLLLEDFADIRQLLREVLEEAIPGIELDEAATLEQARQHITTKTYVLAVIDLHLPDGSGIEIIHEIMKKEPETCCVVATIFDDDQHLFPALEAGAQGYLLKEQPREQLVERFRGIARGEPALSPSIARRVLGYFSRERTSADKSHVDSNLTEREVEVLALLAKGVSRKDAARIMSISSNTVASYIKTIYRKLHISSRSEAALEAARLGIIRTER